jgi:hypothetical protein
MSWIFEAKHRYLRGSGGGVNIALFSTIYKCTKNLFQEVQFFIPKPMLPLA